MSEASPRFGLPFLLPGQAQKEHYHNEALSLIDTALHAAVEGGPVVSPPAAEPQPGQCWIVGTGATGDWAGQDGRLVAWTDGGWRFVAPVPGMAVWDKLSGYRRHWDGAGWSDGAMPVGKVTIGGQQVLGARQPAITTPSNGTTIDVEARAAIGQIIAALMSHGLVG